MGGKLLYLRTNKKHPDIFLAICTLFGFLIQRVRGQSDRFQSVLFWNLGKQKSICCEIPSPPNSFILKKKLPVPIPGLDLKRKGSDSKRYIYTLCDTRFKLTGTCKCYKSD